MPTIIVCNVHQDQGYPPTVDGTPTAFDMTGHDGPLSADLAVEVLRTDGMTLDCPDCRWASSPAVERVLGTVGDPTLPLIGYEHLSGAGVGTAAGDFYLSRQQLRGAGDSGWEKDAPDKPLDTLRDHTDEVRLRKNQATEEETMAKEQSPGEPQPRVERRRGTLLAEKPLGPCTVTVTLLGDLLDIPPGKREAFWQLLDALKAL